MCVAAALGTSNNFSQIASFTHGVYQIDLENLKKGKFIPLHKDEIKDMEFGSGYLLTGSADKSLKLVDTSINRINSTYVCESPIWSVTWNRGKHRVYAGTNKGEVIRSKLFISEFSEIILRFTSLIPVSITKTRSEF